MYMCGVAVNSGGKWPPRLMEVTGHKALLVFQKSLYCHFRLILKHKYLILFLLKLQKKNHRDE